MRHDLKMWERLVLFLEQHGHVHEPAAGRLVFTMSGTGRRVELVMAPHEWADLVETSWGDFRPAAEDLLHTVAESESLERYLVYETYALIRSSEPTLPADPGSDASAKLLAERARGRWSAHDPRTD